VLVAGDHHNRDERKYEYDTTANGIALRQFDVRHVRKTSASVMANSQFILAYQRTLFTRYQPPHVPTGSAPARDWHWNRPHNQAQRENQQ
jgi:hypothetical protein